MFSDIWVQFTNITSIIRFARVEVSNRVKVGQHKELIFVPQFCMISCYFSSIQKKRKFFMSILENSVNSKSQGYT